MSKVIRLTEADLHKMIKEAINEISATNNSDFDRDFEFNQNFNRGRAAKQQQANSDFEQKFNF